MQKFLWLAIISAVSGSTSKVLLDSNADDAFSTVVEQPNPVEDNEKYMTELKQALAIDLGKS